VGKKYRGVAVPLGCPLGSTRRKRLDLLASPPAWRQADESRGLLLGEDDIPHSLMKPRW